jgi:hypothetical protein
MRIERLAQLNRTHALQLIDGPRLSDARRLS